MKLIELYLEEIRHKLLPSFFHILQRHLLNQTFMQYDLDN